MLACMVYIFTNEINNKSRKVLIYLLCLFITLTANLVINFFVKENFFIVAEIKFLAKVVYVQIMLFSYIILFKAYRKSILNHIKKYILNAILIINSVMIISILTSTSLQSYDYTKIGYTGWFFAGNEIGAILAILFPISLMIAVHKNKNYFIILSLDTGCFNRLFFIDVRNKSRLWSPNSRFISLCIHMFH